MVIPKAFNHCQSESVLEKCLTTSFNNKKAILCTDKYLLGLELTELGGEGA